MIRKWQIKIVRPDGTIEILDGAGKANKEHTLRDTCTAVAQSTGGKVWVTEMNAKAWQVWNCPKGDKYGYRNRVVYK